MVTLQESLTNLPVLLEVYAHTLITDPSKVMLFPVVVFLPSYVVAGSYKTGHCFIIILLIKQISNALIADPDKLCGSDLDEIFTIPMNLERKFKEAMDGICNINFTAFGKQVGGLVGDFFVSYTDIIVSINTFCYAAKTNTQMQAISYE